MVGPFHSGTIITKKLKYPNIIEENQRKELEKEGQNDGTNTSDSREVVPLGWKLCQCMHYWVCIFYIRNRIMD